MIYYRHFIGDYLQKTVHLTMLQDAAYRRMIDEYYKTEKPLTLDRKLLYARVRANTAEEQWAVDSILGEFFSETKRGFTNKRAEEEIRSTNLRAKVSQQNGLRGGRPKTKQVISRLRSGTLNESSSDFRLQTSDLNIKPKVKGVCTLPGFDRFYAEYPRKVDPDKARAAWLKIPFIEQHVDEVMVGLSKWMVCPQWQDRQFIPHPATFLNNRRWESEPQMENANGTSKNNSRARNAIDSERTERARSEGVVL